MFCFAVFLASCSKDLGNYEYTDINELAISGVNGNYTARTGIDTIRINPKILATMDESDPSRYEHRWVLRLSGTKLDTIGREQNLVYAVRLNPGTNNFYYRVRDTKTGVTWIANSVLNVSTSYSRGWLIMGENEEGFAEAEMISIINDDTVHIKNILTNSGLPPLREPVSLLHTGGAESYSNMKVWALTKTGSYFLDRATMTATTNNNFSRLLYISETLDPQTLHPIAIAPQIRTAAGLVGSQFYRAKITVAKDVFTGSPLLGGGDYFNNPVNRVATDPQTRLPAAPYLLHSIGNMSTFLWYDLQNQRFLNYTSFAAIASVPLADVAGSIFPWNQPAGRTLVYAENTRNSDGGATNGNSFAIMKDANNTHHIYKFYATGANPIKRAFYTVKPIATNFDKADFYAFSSNRTVIFYSVGSKLYSYDYNPNNERLLEHTEHGGDEISMLKFDTQFDHVTNSLYIASYNGAAKGKLQRFRVGTNPNVVELLPQPNSTWTDLIKVKDINWRAVN